LRELKRINPTITKSEIGNRLSETWRNLSPSKKAVYESLAKVDLERYYKEK
jgi:hypothetical protein